MIYPQQDSRSPWNQETFEMSALRGFEEICRSARISILEMTNRAKSAHVGSSLSVVEILVASYTRAREISSTSRVFLSKGHAAAALYAVLSELDYLPKEMLLTFCSDGSLLSGHASHSGIPSIPLSTGSLGHALPVATGVALNNKLVNSPDETLVILSDGECDEGSNWEAALFAAHHKLSNLKVIIDRNGLQSITTTENTLSLEPLSEKWASFGWDVRVSDGHDVDSLLFQLGVANAANSRPIVIIASTTKGKGVSFMENSNVWHYKSPSSDDVALAQTQLGAKPSE
jgi:transketolase